MIGDGTLKKLKPEKRKLSEHLPFVRNAGGEDVVKRRDAIGGDEEKALGESDIVLSAASAPATSRICRVLLCI